MCNNVKQSGFDTVGFNKAQFDEAQKRMQKAKEDFEKKYAQQEASMMSSTAKMGEIFKAATTIMRRPRDPEATGMAKALGQVSDILADTLPDISGGFPGSVK